MRKLRLASRRLTERWQGRRYTRGSLYVVEDADADAMLASGLFEEATSLIYGRPASLATRDIRAAGARLVVIRDGGIGDLVLLLPALRELAAQRDGAGVVLACDPRYIRTFSVPFLAGVVGLGEALRTSPHAIDLRWMVEREKNARTTPRHELFGALLGVRPVPPVVPVRVDRDLARAARARLRGAGWAGEPVVAVCPSGTTTVRRIEPEPALEVCRGIARAGGWSVMLHVAPVELPPGPRILDLSGKLSVEEAVAWVSVSNAVVSPDTGLAHVAGSLGIPLVAVFSTWPSALRLSWYDAVALEPVELSCFPCHDRGCGSVWCTAWRHPAEILAAVAEVLAPRWRLPVPEIDVDPADWIRYGSPVTPEVGSHERTDEVSVPGARRSPARTALRR